jgi:hypothetical protein
MPHSPRERGRLGSEQRSGTTAERRTDRKAEEDANVQRYSPTRRRAIVGVLVEIGDNFTFKWFHEEATLLFRSPAE